MFRQCTVDRPESIALEEVREDSREGQSEERLDGEVSCYLPGVVPRAEHDRRQIPEEPAQPSVDAEHA